MNSRHAWRKEGKPPFSSITLSQSHGSSARSRGTATGSGTGTGTTGSFDHSDQGMGPITPRRRASATSDVEIGTGHQLEESAMPDWRGREVDFGPKKSTDSLDTDLKVEKET